jgi:RNA polymerase sigma factor (sigma-70 family)
VTWCSVLQHVEGGNAVTEPTRTERFQQVALPHLNAAYNLARWLTRNDHDAEDIVQEAYLRAFKFFDGFHGEDARAWLLAVVRNTTYTWLQRNREHSQSTPFDEEVHSLEGTSSLGTVGQADNNPESIRAQQDRDRLLNRALEQLPVEFREVLVLRELEDLSYKEIASVASIPIGTVMSRLARGRKLLGECLRRIEKESSDGLQRNSGTAPGVR